MEQPRSAPLLSICIPTYNQPEAFSWLFGVLKDQFTRDIEVIVRDDSANDETEKIVRGYNKEGLPCRYVRGKKEGLDSAILSLTEMAAGKYVWWIGDDTIAQDAVARILKVISDRGTLSLIFLNSREENASRPTFQLGGDKVFSDPGEVIEIFSDSLGFISATILNREDAQSGLEKAREVIGTAWVNLFLVLHTLGKGRPAYFLQEPILLTVPRDPAKPAWYDGFTVFSINFYRVISRFKKVFPRRSVHRALAKNLKKIWHGILVYRAQGYTHGLGGPHANARALFPLYWNFAQFWVALPFLLLPRSWIPILYRWYLRIFR